MTKKDLKLKTDEIYEMYDSGVIDSGDALMRVIDVIEKYTDVSKKKEPKKEGPEYGIFLCKELDKALKEFGKYTYHDKGADEVMNISKYTDVLKLMSIKEIADILSFVLDNHNDAVGLVESIISSLDELNFDELFNHDERFTY